MNTQPEALRLADLLGRLADEGPNWQVLELAAAELRRLHDYNIRLLEAAGNLIDQRDGYSNRIAALEALNQELLKALKMAQQGIESMTCWEHPDDPAHPWTDCAKQIRTAIAKAEAA